MKSLHGIIDAYIKADLKNDNSKKQELIVIMGAYSKVLNYLTNGHRINETPNSIKNDFWNDIDSIINLSPYSSNKMYIGSFLNKNR